MSTQIDTGLLNGLGLSGRPAGKAKDELGQESFLKLMTTQLQNQDPFKPMENGDFLAQMAQFGTVSGIQDLQKSFENFAGSISSNQGLQAASLIGRSVVVPGDSVQLSSTGDVKGSVELPSDASDVTAKIYDASGQLVRSVRLGPQTEGHAQYQWDGLAADGTRLPAGSYYIEVDAVIRGETIALQNYIESKVESVTFGGLGSEMQISLTGVGDRPFSQVRQIRG